MNHTPSKIKVFKTEDYSLFQNVDGNRPLNKKKIARIVAEIQSGNDILDEVPVLVKEAKSKLHVLDGQHRVQIAKELSRPVHYIIHKEDMSLYKVAKVNSNVEKWSDADFIRCYEKAGNTNYKRIREFHEQYGIAVGLCLTMLASGSVSDGGSSQEKHRQDFETGLFEVKKMKEARMLAELCKNFEAFKAWNTRPFIIAINKLVIADLCNFDVLIKKFSEDPGQLPNQSNWKAYLTSLEAIYNKGNSKRRTIF